jgi:hypothetical protein
VKIRHVLSTSLLFLLLGCNRAPQSKDAVKQAVVEHLSKSSSLDISQMDIDVTSVTFKDNTANATVSFRPKSSPDQGMQMSYALESKGNKWSVVKKSEGGSPHGGTPGAPGASAPPSPHGATPPQGDLPPGHPPVSGKKEAAPGSSK